MNAGIAGNVDWPRSPEPGGLLDYLNLDELLAAADDDATIIYRENVNAYGNSAFNFIPAFAITTSGIDKVTVGLRVKTTGTIAGLVAALLCGAKDGTASVYTGVIATSVSYADWTNVAKDWLTNPATGAAWTEEELEQTDATVAHRCVGGRVRANPTASYRISVTALELSVTFTGTDDDPTGGLIKPNPPTGGMNEMAGGMA